MSIKIDDSDYKTKSKKFIDEVTTTRRNKAVKNVASEILRLSQKEVPHDVGSLQNSGHVEDRKTESIVGYNTRYAARLHEHPEYNFKKGRKGKFLEDPIKMNFMVFREIFRNIFK